MPVSVASSAAPRRSGPVQPALPLVFMRDAGGWSCPLWGETPDGRRFRATLRIEPAPEEVSAFADPAIFLGMHI